MNTPTPRIRPGSVLRHAVDGRRYIVKAVRRAEPHTGFSQIFGLEPQPMPLVPDRAPRRKKKPYRKPQWF
jgi:hypothetical protein